MGSSQRTCTCLQPCAKCPHSCVHVCTNLLNLLLFAVEASRVLEEVVVILSDQTKGLSLPIATAGSISSSLPSKLNNSSSSRLVPKGANIINSSSSSGRRGCTRSQDDTSGAQDASPPHKSGLLDQPGRQGDVGRLAALFDLSLLKFQQRDLLLEAFKRYRQKVGFW